MKNRATNLLLSITILFVGITIGFSLGRNANHEPVQLSVFQSADTAGTTQTATVAATNSTTTATTLPDTTTDTTVQVAVDHTVPPQETSTTLTGLVNVNTADLATLMLLPGIGEVLAQRIIDYREAYGNFHTLEELANVSGIGEKRLNAILNYATVGG